MSERGQEPGTSTGADAGGGGASVSAAGDVVRRAGDVEAVEIVHRDDSVTRLTSDTVLSTPPSTGGEGPAIGLETGSSWHRVADGDSGFRVELPHGSASSTDGTFTVVCEPNGAVFVVCLDGQVLVEGDDNGTLLRSMQAVDLSPAGALGEPIDVTEDELRTDPWVAANLTLGPDAAAASVAARLPVAEREPEPAANAGAVATEPEPVPETAGPETEAAEHADADTAAAVVAPDPAQAEAGTAEAEAEAESRPEPEPEPDVADDEAAAGGATAVLAVPAVDERERDEALEGPEEAELEPAGAGRDHVIVVGRGQRRQPTLWVALVLAVIAVALFAIARKTENDRTPTVIDQQQASRTTVLPGPLPTTPSQASSTEPPTTTPDTSAPASTATTAAPVEGVTYDITLTKCSQSGSAIAAEGAITNKANVVQSYRVTVRFLGADKTTKVAEAVGNVTNVQPKQRVSWKATGSYAGNLRNAGGCETERVDIV